MNEASSVNVSQNATGSVPGVSPHLWQVFLATCQASAVFLVFLSALTTLANGLLLLALYKDPLKCLRQPPTILISSLAVADFLTGILVEPVFSYFYFQVSRNQLTAEGYEVLLKLAGFFSGVTMTTSFLTILLLSLMQLAAITFPHRHRAFITRKRVLKCVAATWVYSIICSTIVFVGISEEIYKKFSVYVNLTFVHILVLLTYIALYASYRRQLDSSSSTFRTGSDFPPTSVTERHRKSQRHLIVVCLMLSTCQVVFVTPVTIMWYINLYWQPDSSDALTRGTTASVIIDSTLFLKFLVDPFIYTWRLPRFRRAIRVVFIGKSSQFDHHA